MNAETQIDRADWLAARRTGIGGSDVAPILGLSKWRSPLDVYMVKRGKRAAKVATLATLAMLLTACGQPACDPHPGYRPDGQQCN